MWNNLSSINYSHMNSLLNKLDKDDDDSNININEEKTPNLSMFISSSYFSGEIQDIHDGSNMKENEMNNTLNILSKREQVLDKSINFQNIREEEELINKDKDFIGKETGIEPIIESGYDEENESFYHDNIQNLIENFEKQKVDLFNDNNNNINSINNININNTINNNNINNNINNNLSLNNSTLNEPMMNNFCLIDESDKIRIKKNLIYLKHKNNSSYNSTFLSSTKENLNNNNKSVLTDNKKIFFNVTKQNDDFITDTMDLNLSSCQLSCKSKKSKRGRKQVLLSGVKTEIMDKTFLREFKKYLKLKKKEFENIFEEDPIFWNEFLKNNNPPFLFSVGGKEVEFKSYGKNFMNFIFSRPGVNTLYSRFISENKEIKYENIFPKKKKNKKGPDNYTQAFYKFYRENLNKLYSKDFSEFDINVDDIDLNNDNNVSMDLVNNSFQ